MKKLLFMTAASAAFLAATPAFAEDATNGPKGVRLEAIIGADRPAYDMEEVFGIDDSVHMNGLVYGIGLGYDLPISSNISLGVDLEATASTSKRTEEFVGDFGGFDFDVEGKVKAGRDLYAGIRMTAAVSPKINFYVKGGYTNARLKASIKGTIDGVSFDVSEGENGGGVRVGAGLQYALGGNTYVGIEGRYSNYKYDLSRTQLAATIGVRF